MKIKLNLTIRIINWGWSHRDKTALGPDNGTSNNTMKVKLGLVWLGKVRMD